MNSDEKKLKLQDLIEEMPLPQVESDRIEVIGIIGGGIMGVGIAQAASQAGLDVIIVEKDEASAERSKKRLNEIWIGKFKDGE